MTNIGHIVPEYEKHETRESIPCLKLGSPLLYLNPSVKQFLVAALCNDFSSILVGTSEFTFVIILTIVVIVCLQSYDSMMSFFEGGPTETWQSGCSEEVQTLGCMTAT